MFKNLPLIAFGASVLLLPCIFAYFGIFSLYSLAMFLVVITSAVNAGRFLGQNKLFPDLSGKEDEQKDIYGNEKPLGSTESDRIDFSYLVSFGGVSLLAFLGSAVLLAASLFTYLSGLNIVPAMEGALLLFAVGVFFSILSFLAGRFKSRKVKKGLK